MTAARADAERVIVVGAGIGGLVSALLLACRGLPVTLVEQADRVGGKMRALLVDGMAIDGGPTVFTMRWVFDQILDEAGSSTDALMRLQPLSVLARHAWRGQARSLDLHADVRCSADEISAFASPQEAQRFLAFCQEARRIYQRLEGPHIRSSRPGFWQMVRDLGPRGLQELTALGPFASLWRTLGRHFHDPRLRQLFARYATYCGASPWQAPATLMLVAHVEMDGVWSIDGGMDGLAQALADMAVQRGVQLRLNSPVQTLLGSPQGVSGVRLRGGEELSARRVVFNGDVNALARGWLGTLAREAIGAPLQPRQRSLSALTWAMHVRTQGFVPARHNVFFDADYRSEFDDIFRQRRLPRQGTVYLCAQDRSDGRDALPAGPERLLALVNAPADGDRRTLSPTEIEACESRCLKLMQDCGLTLDISHPATQVRRRTPGDFNALFPGSGGALYGPATHGWMALFRRHGARTRLPGLYLAGGSVHPGPGVPMAAMSGRLAAATLMGDLASTQRSSRVHIAGGTWTPSARTAATR
ncbi:MAG: phytoene desaturase [Rubrivivax sp.]|nr:phytoene desaturase [Rubrivivax sp.]